LTTDKKILLVLGGGVLQEQTFPIARSMGLIPVLVDGNANCWCVKNGLVDKDDFILASAYDTDKIILSVNDYISSHPGSNLLGVYTQGADFEYPVAVIAYNFGLPGIPATVAYTCNNKIAMRNAFFEAGISQPSFTTARTVEDIERAFDSYGVCVVKAVDNCASRGVTIVRSKEQIPQALELSKKFSRREGPVLVEEFISGKEYSVDTIIDRGKLYPCGISSRVFEEKELFAIQNGSITPSDADEGLIFRIYDIMRRAYKALDISQGAFKGDIIVSGDKVSIIEVTARLSGGFDAQYRKPASYGMNLIKATIELAVGWNINKADVSFNQKRYSKTFTVFPKPGKIAVIKGYEELKALPGIVAAFLMVKEGDVIKEYENCADRVIHIIAVADTLAELNAIQKQAEDTIQIITHE